MSKPSYAVVLISLVAPALVFSRPVNAQLTGSYGSAGGQYAVPGGWYNPNYPVNSNPSGSQVSTLYQQAFAEGERGNYAGEVQIYSQIVRIDPQAANAYYNRGLVKKNKLNDRVGAIQDFQNAAAIYRQKGENYMFQDCINKLQSLGAM
jgi:tetratricopeptide (TPR) repeat protein